MKKNNKSIHTLPLDIDHLENNLKIIPREVFDLFEYKEFPDDRLRQNYLENLKRFIVNDKNFSISLVNNNLLQGYILIEYMQYDSEIFGFNVYRLSEFCVFGKNDLENKLIGQSLIEKLENKINKFKIKYLTVSINANKSVSSLLFNLLIKNSFYYINTLITFKMFRNEFDQIRLYKKTNDNITIRYSNKEDSGAISKIASKSYQINRFHLDRNLNKKKCDLLHAKSAENSILHGFADIMFVAEYKNEIVGYYSGKKHFNSIIQATFGNAVISAVSEKARGLGIFSLMNYSLLEWFHNHTDLAEMGTYLTNRPVHKTWTDNRLNIVRGSYQLAKFFA